jgi:hypothetical protein
MMEVVREGTDVSQIRCLPAQLEGLELETSYLEASNVASGKFHPCAEQRESTSFTNEPIRFDVSEGAVAMVNTNILLEAMGVGGSHFRRMKCLSKLRQASM